jgi:hypothetical protein
MERIIAFIKDFKLSSYGLDIWDMWLIFGIIIIAFALSNWIISFSPALTSGRLKKWLAFFFYSIFYGVMVFMILNAVLTNDYARLSALIFGLILPNLRPWIDKFYRGYDNLVDKIISRK